MWQESNRNDFYIFNLITMKSNFNIPAKEIRYGAAADCQFKSISYFPEGLSFVASTEKLHTGIYENYRLGVFDGCNFNHHSH